MLLSDVSIGRPVLATVMSLLIVLLGLAAYGRLPVREYPDVDLPVVSVSTTYVGASPQTVEATVTEPIEQRLNGIEGIRDITSVSRFGGSSITVEFLPGRDIDAAATDVSNAVQTALDRLPDEAERPIVSKAGADTRPIMWLVLKSDHHSAIDLTDIADRYVKTPLQLLPGVATIYIGGQRTYAMRIWLDPARMAALRVDPSDVRRTVLENNLQLPAGALEGTTRKYVVLADAQLADPALYERLIIRRDQEHVVRIGDVGRVELGSENYNTITRFTQDPVISVGVVRQSRANELALAAAVRGALPAIRDALPDGITLDVGTDRARFVQASLDEVWATIGIVFVVVVLVNLIFLRSIATTIIPSLAIPTSLIGTFAVMAVLGFSINVLTLLALVLAIGLLVDDAIVVMENVYRRQEHGESRMLAALRGSREVGFPVIATTVSLVAVLVPLSLMTGSTGRLFREFSVSMAAAVVISTFVALSLVPMACAKFLYVTSAHGRVYNTIERGFVRLNHGYERALAWAVAHAKTIAVFLVANVVLSVVLFAVLPHTLVPIEDRGQLLVLLRAPQGSTLAYTRQSLEQAEAHLAAVPEVEGFFAAVGLASGGSRNTTDGFIYARLKEWRERSVTQQTIVAELLPKLMAIPTALVFPLNLPSLGQRSLNDIELIIKNASADLDEFGAVRNALLERLREIPGLVNIDSDLELDNPQIDVVFDREQAADLGVPISTIAATLQVLMSEGRTDEFILRNKQYDVIIALAAPFRAVPEQIGEVAIRTSRGEMVKLGAVIEMKRTVAPAALSHFDLERSATLTASLGPDAALGDTLARVQAAAREILPPGFTTALGGAARDYAESSTDIYVAFGLALLFIYLVLAAQFENFLHPLTILLSVPLALFGALLTLAATGNTVNLYSQIGIILLVGLVTKNSILLIDYANQARARGLDLLDAVTEAGRTRFRPILMTSATSILGAVPLVLRTGAGAESRAAIGATVVGGLVFSTVFTLLAIPVVYIGLTRLGERLGLSMIPPLIALAEDDAPPPADPRPADQAPPSRVRRIGT
jgi:multidrug efflux pump